MRKNEMSEVQMYERAMIITMLSAAGWNTSDQNKMFDEGLWTYFEVNMDYQNDSVRILLRYEAEKRVIYFSTQDAGGKELTLHIYYEGQLEQLLRLIVGFQDVISGENYNQYVRDIVRLCPSTYAAVGEEGEQLVQVVDTEHVINPIDQSNNDVEN